MLQRVECSDINAGLQPGEGEPEGGLPMKLSRTVNRAGFIYDYAVSILEHQVMDGEGCGQQDHLNKRWPQSEPGKAMVGLF